MDENKNTETTAEEEYADITAAEAESEYVDITAAKAENDTAAENIGSEFAEIGSEEKPVKKKRLLQLPVIISLIIVVAALLGYLGYSAFLLREPEGLTWSIENDGTKYYYDFKNDGTVKLYIGTAEIEAGFEKAKSTEGSTITIVNNSANSGLALGNFYIGLPATYTVTGSRILKNQTIECTYDSIGYSFTLNQDKREAVELEVPNDFVADNDIIGTWHFRDDYKVTFGEDGTMSFENVQAKTVINGVYTITDHTINFTYVIDKNTVVPFEYTVDGDVLNFMEFNFVRDGSDSTADQQIIMPQYYAE